MEVIYLLIPLSLVLVAVIVGFVIWAVKSGQFEDLERPGYRILDDDDGIQPHREEASPGRSRENGSSGDT
jgi:cbb3-type cytochrome oxidase maturation protein